ncbi:MAG: hypothetical protein AB7F86_01230 [Bdellovibrionales bacterium]
MSRWLSLVLALTLALPVGAERILTNTDIHLRYMDTRQTPSGVQVHNFFATDIRTNRDYVVIVASRGSNWVSMVPREIQYNPDLGGRAVVTGLASDDVRDRIRTKLAQEKDGFRQWKQDKYAKPPEMADNSRPKKDEKIPKPDLRPGDRPGSGRSDEIDFGKIGPGQNDGQTDWQRWKARQTPFVVGQTLDSMGWDAQAQYKAEMAQNDMIREHQRMVDADLAARLERQGFVNSQIKANMIASLHEYLERPAPGGVPVEDGILTRIDLTEEGRSSMRQDLQKFKEEHQWNRLADRITGLSNPWSGSPADPALRGYADHQGIMNGPVIRPDSIQISGRESMVHRIRQVANRLQAFALQDDSWKSGTYMARIVTNAALAIRSSALLESMGVKDEAEKLLGFAEAATQFLQGRDEGILIGVVQGVAGLAELVVTGYEAVEFTAKNPQQVVKGLKSAAEFFGDPELVREATEQIYTSLTQQAPKVLSAAWKRVVHHALHDSARDRGRIAGRVIAEVGMAVLGAEVAQVAKGALSVGKVARLEVAADELATAILKKADKVAYRSEQLAAIGKKTGPYVRDLPDIRELAATMKDPKAAEALRSFANAFEAHIFKGDLKPGDILFQSQRLNQTQPGSWFSVIRPTDSVEAEELLNIFKHGNYAEKMTTYVVKEPISIYAGKVAGGNGHQIMFPTHPAFNRPLRLLDVLEEVETIKLPFNGGPVGQ